MIDRSRLDPLSQAFAESLFESFPEWKPLAEYVPNVGTDELGLAVRIVHPQNGRTLTLRSADSEIFISYDAWHEHFEAWGLPSSDVVAYAMADIRNFLTEQKVIKVNYRAGKWSGSDFGDASDSVNAAPGLTTTVLSWNGTYDRTV